jgi:hypothetical protein
VTRFLQLVTEKHFAEAERVFERLKENVQKNEWNRGYLQALHGMLLAQKLNDDRYVFILNANLNDEKELKKYRNEFLKHAKNMLHADYDRGFFSAWAEYIRLLLKMKHEGTQLQAQETGKAAEKATLIQQTLDGSGST